MKRWLAIFLLVLGATGARAEGMLNLSWNACTGPIDRAVAPGDTAGIFVSVINQSSPHKAYEIWLLLRPAVGFGAMRDAWRFDAAGCENASLHFGIDPIAPASVAKACPTFSGPLQTIQFRDYSYDATTGSCQAVFANSYPVGNTTQTNPATRYFLARFRFDFTAATTGPTVPGVACGGLEVPVCVLMTKQGYLRYDPANPSDATEFTWLVQQDFVTANNPSMSLCWEDPARPTTWGSIKSQYRR